MVVGIVRHYSFDRIVEAFHLGNRFAHAVHEIEERPVKSFPRLRIGLVAPGRRDAGDELKNGGKIEHDQIAARTFVWRRLRPWLTERVDKVAEPRQSLLPPEFSAKDAFRPG